MGNNRIVTDHEGGVLQSIQYYPFGLEFAGGEGQALQPYKYGGKELDSNHNLNLYDFSARYFDPAVPRFTSIDPLAEKYYSISPYAYVMNNPLRYIDPTGMSPEDDERKKKENESFWQSMYNAFNQMMEGVVYTMGFHPDQMNSENPAVREDARQKRANTQEALHTANETLLSIVPVGEVTYKKLNDREISASEYGWAAAELVPMGKVGKLGKYAIGSTSIWTKTKRLTAVENALEHWGKHGKEFPEFQNAKQYVEGTIDFLHNSPSGTLMKTRSNGDVLKYYPKTNTFGVMDVTGTPRTMFKPTDGMEYWLKQ